MSIDSPGANAGKESTVAGEPAIVSLTYAGDQPPATANADLPPMSFDRELLKFHTPTCAALAKVLEAATIVAAAKADLIHDAVRQGITRSLSQWEVESLE
jgi:hypothetical protein